MDNHFGLLTIKWDSREYYIGGLCDGVGLAIGLDFAFTMREHKAKHHFHLGNTARRKRNRMAPIEP